MIKCWLKMLNSMHARHIIFRSFSTSFRNDWLIFLFERLARCRYVVEWRWIDLSSRQKDKREASRNRFRQRNKFVEILKTFTWSYFEINNSSMLIESSLQFLMHWVFRMCENRCVHCMRQSMKTMNILKNDQFIQFVKSNFDEH